MNLARTSRRIKAAGYTLAEISVAMGLVGVVGLILYSTLSTTLRLSSVNVVTNVSNYRARQTLDRIGEIVRYAQDTPLLINKDGTVATGNTSDGIIVKNSVDGPYVFKNANGQADAEIPDTAKTFIVEFSPSANVVAPTVGDFFTLALSKHPELEVTTVSTPIQNGGVSKVTITTQQALGELAKPGIYTVGAYRYRKEAFVFAQSGERWELRHFGSLTALSKFNEKAYYRVMGTGYSKLGDQPFFVATTTVNGTRSVTLRAVARSSDHAEHVEGRTGSALTSMPLEIDLWNYNTPAPPES
jgi:hypothetical protein